MDTYLWPYIVLYRLFVRRNFVVCCHVSLTNEGVPRVEIICGTMLYILRQSLRVILIYNLNFFAEVAFEWNRPHAVANPLEYLGGGNSYISICQLSYTTIINRG